MKLYSKNYIVSGDIFVDQTVLCMRCSTPMIITGYREMPKINNPKQKVNVACKIKQGNYKLLPVVLEKGGKKGMMHIPLCADCVKEVSPEKESDDIISQIVEATKKEAKWNGSPEAALAGIDDHFSGIKIVRKMTDKEIRENKILEVA